MKWTMNGSRPVSSLAISVMKSFGGKMDGKGGWKFSKPKKKRAKRKR